MNYSPALQIPLWIEPIFTYRTSVASKCRSDSKYLCVRCAGEDSRDHMGAGRRESWEHRSRGKHSMGKSCMQRWLIHPFVSCLPILCAQFCVNSFTFYRQSRRAQNIHIISSCSEKFPKVWVWQLMTAKPRTRKYPFWALTVFTLNLHPDIE